MNKKIPGFEKLQQISVRIPGLAGRDLKLRLPEYEAGVLTTRPLGSVLMLEDPVMIRLFVLTCRFPQKNREDFIFYERSL
jgi:hypothetical protein